MKNVLNEVLSMMSEKKKAGGTFVVHVTCCENATWQGEVVWTEENKKRRFRSALELMKLMDSALETGEAQEQQTFADGE